MESSAQHCYHCNASLQGEAHAVAVGNDSFAVCSAACATAVKSIHGSGLGDFYLHRSGTAQSKDATQGPISNWETYERPAVMREFVRGQTDGTQIADLLVQGVHCAACTWLIENTLNKIPGVLSITVNPITTRGELHWDPQHVRLAELMRTIEQIGYLPTPFTEQSNYEASEQARRLALRRLLVAGLGMMQVTSFAVALYLGAFQGMDPIIQEFLRYVSLLVATPIVLYSGAPFFAGAWRNIRSRHPGMDVPVALAIGAAWSASVWNTFAGSGDVFFDSATMFVFFLSGTRYLEAAGRRSAIDLTSALAQHIPCTTTRLTAAGSEEIGVMELEANDRVRVVAGTAFPADGVLENSSTSIDESMLTGESVPVKRSAGDAVVAGTINLANTVTLKIEKTGADTVLAQIGRLVTLAGSSKPKLIQLTDRIASVFVSVVLLIAAGTGIGWYLLEPDRAFEVVLTVLVVTCPCALALATPAAFTVATSTLARMGFLVRRGGALQALASVNHVVFDKTGTLTENQLEISAVETLGNLSAAEVQRIAAALEAHSAHPIARAFSSSAEVPATQLHVVAGGGLEGHVDGKPYRIGTAAFAAGLSAAGTPADADAARCVWLADAQGLLARFVLAEELRIGAAHLIANLRGKRIVSSIASGDRETAVAALAATVGVHDWHGAMLPEDKLAFVRNLQQEHKTVAVVGDGVNDAPVLAGANVSIAMGSGTSIAQHSADCVWLGTQLHGLDQAFSIAQDTMRVVKQNLVWALAYNLAAIPLAVTGMLQPWMAALGMSLSSLLVMLNALRLGRARTPEPAPASTTAGSCCSKQVDAAA